MIKSAAMKALIRTAPTFLLLLFLNVSASAQELESLTSDDFEAILEETSLSWERSGDSSFISTDGDGSWAASVVGNEIGFGRVLFVEATTEDLNEWNSTSDIPEAIEYDGNLLLEHYMLVNGASPSLIIDTFEWFRESTDKAIEFFEGRQPTS